MEIDNSHRMNKLNETGSADRPYETSKHGLADMRKVIF
jgi:hypothetical protein